MPGKLDELKRRLEQTAREVDDKYDISGKLDQGARVANDTIRKGAEAASATYDAVRDEVSRIDREKGISRKVSDTVRSAAGATEAAIKDSGAADAAKKAVDETKSRASEIFGEAREYYKNASDAARASTSAARLPSSMVGALSKARNWMKRNPGKAAVVSLAFVAGTRAGAAFTSLDVALLGAGGAGSWLFHSAAVPYGLRKLTEKYESHLRKQEQLARDGELSEAERSRVQFERDVVKYVGAPLLGAFSIAAGAGLVYEAVTGGVVTGLPINLVLGGNPLLSSIWLFANGLVCFHNGYKFFMIALADEETVQRVVRDIKGLIPSAAIS